MDTLKIDSLTVSIKGKKILKDFSLTLKSGEIHVIMGVNGIGKSTLLKVIMGDDNYKIEKGSICFNSKKLNDLSVDERARLGIFLGMQLPLEIEGVSNADFLRSAIANKEKENFKLFEFIKELDKNIELLHMNPNMIHRNINEGFSGGERKKNEILQMHMLKPKVVMLDEIDSGLDVDSLKIVGENVMAYYKEFKPMILLITHYERLLNYIKPSFVHIMQDGKIIKTGDFSLVKEIEKEGFEKYKNCSSIGTCIVKEIIGHE